MVITYNRGTVRFVGSDYSADGRVVHFDTGVPYKSDLSRWTFKDYAGVSVAGHNLAPQNKMKGIGAYPKDNDAVLDWDGGLSTNIPFMNIGGDGPRTADIQGDNFDLCISDLNFEPEGKTPIEMV